MDKQDVAEILDEMGFFYELQGANAYKIRAYHKAARTMENLNEDLETIVFEDRLKTLPGIGKVLSKNIETLVRTGQLPEYDNLKKKLPQILIELINDPSSTLKKIKHHYKHLKIKTYADLITACRQRKIEELQGFKAKNIENILRGISKQKSYQERMLWSKAHRIADKLLYKLSKHIEIEKVEVAGSFRRKMETVGDLDLVVSSNNPKAVLKWFTKQPFVSEVLLEHSNRAKIRIKQGIAINLIVVLPYQFPFTLFYYTGSKEHNKRIEELALKKGVSLNTLISEKIEGDIYKKINLPYIPPELREGIDEFKTKKIPKLIEDRDIKGIFHCHTTDSDGHNTVDEMVDSAIHLGWDYIGISDHSKSSFQANGMDEERLLNQIAYIRGLQKKIDIFAGIECDILSDGTLDFSDDILKYLDFVIVSIHRRYKLDEKMMTKRLIKAIENPYTTMIGHLTGRLLLSRAEAPLNIPKVIDAAIANNKIIEINGYPNRLDMDWRYWHAAKDKGLKCCINPDAHSTRELLNFHYGVNIARKGWLTKVDVMNTWSLKKVKRYLNL